MSVVQALRSPALTLTGNALAIIARDSDGDIALRVGTGSSDAQADNSAQQSSVSQPMARCVATDGRATFAPRTADVATKGTDMSPAFRFCLQSTPAITQTIPEALTTLQLADLALQDNRPGRRARRRATAGFDTDCQSVSRSNSAARAKRGIAGICGSGQ